MLGTTVACDRAVELIKIQQDARADPSGRELGEYLAARLLLEQSVRTRVLLAHMTAVLGMVLWTAVLLSLPPRALQAAIAAFAVSLALFAGAVRGEVVHRRAIRARGRKVRAEEVR